MSKHVDPAGLEIRSEGENHDLDAISRLVEEFRNTSEQSQTRQDAERAKLEKRMADLEVRLNRPGHQEQRRDETPIEERAFDAFLRRGYDRLPEEQRAVLVAGTDANGGYLAPESIEKQILQALVEYSPIRQYANVMSISAPEIKIPRLVSGPSATWVDETEDRTATDATFEQVSLAPGELASYLDISNRLLEDNAYNLESRLNGWFGEAFGKIEAAAFVKGDGLKNKPKGLLNATGVAEIKTGNASTLGAAPADLVIALYHALPTTYAQRGVWLLNRSTLKALRTLKDADGRFLLADPITANMPTTLLGRPVVEAIDMDDIAANKNPIMFGDLSGYQIVDRIGLTTLRDPYTQATKGATRIHVRRRVGGDVIDAARLVKLKVAA